MVAAAAGQVTQVDCTADDDADTDCMTPKSEIIQTKASQSFTSHIY